MGFEAMRVGWQLLGLLSEMLPRWLLLNFFLLTTMVTSVRATRPIVREIGRKIQVAGRRLRTKLGLASADVAAAHVALREDAADGPPTTPTAQEEAAEPAAATAAAPTAVAAAVAAPVAATGDGARLDNGRR